MCFFISLFILIMANTNQAKKRARQAETHRLRNTSSRSMMRTYLKNTIAAIDEKDKKTAAEKYLLLVPVLDKSVSKGLIHKNKAARYKSRLNTKIKSLS